MQDRDQLNMNMCKITNGFKFAIVLSYSVGVMACAPAEKVVDGVADDRPNPPYFPIGENCKLPDLSPDMEVKQTKVIEHLAKGIPEENINQTVLVNGMDFMAKCGSGSDFDEEKVFLYLDTRNLHPTNIGEIDFCPNGTSYTALVSTRSLRYTHVELDDIILCESMNLYPVGSYGLKVCFNNNEDFEMLVTDRNDPSVQDAELPNCQ